MAARAAPAFLPPILSSGNFPGRPLIRSPFVSLAGERYRARSVVPVKNRRRPASPLRFQPFSPLINLKNEFLKSPRARR